MYSTRSLRVEPSVAEGLDSTYNMQLHTWDNAIPLHGPGRTDVAAPSRWVALKPHLLYVLRAMLGTALSSTLLFIFPNVLSGTGRFFAIIIPFLAIGPTLGATLNQFAGLPAMLGVIAFATLIVEGGRTHTRTPNTTTTQTPPHARTRTRTYGFHSSSQ
jgi:hypothetical protein